MGMVVKLGRKIAVAVGEHDTGGCYFVVLNRSALSHVCVFLYVITRWSERQVQIGYSREMTRTNK
jgi:hypothetical protein